MGLNKLFTKKITRKRLNCFIKKHATNKKTLDLGCGNSPYSKYFPNRIGLDLEKSKNIDIVGNVHALSFKDKTFDTVLSTELLEHVKNPQKAIDEMKRVLKPNGKLILTTRFIFPLHDTPNDYYRFTKYGLRYLLREWDIVEIEEETDTIGTMAILFQRVAIQCNILNFKPLKVFLHAIAYIIKHFGSIIKEEYGAENVPEKNIMASGYYVIAFNKKRA